MNPEERRELRWKLKRTVQATKKATGKKPTKKELGSVEMEIAKTIIVKSKENWVEPNQPESIDNILRRKNDRT